MMLTGMVENGEPWIERVAPGTGCSAQPAFNTVTTIKQCQSCPTSVSALLRVPNSKAAVGIGHLQLARKSVEPVSNKQPEHLGVEMV